MGGYAIEYTDLDFRPAPPGWRLAYLTDTDVGYYSVDLPGWLIQVEERYSRSTFKPCDGRPFGDRPRRVVAAGYDEDMLTEGGAAVNFWCVLGPSDPEPTAAEAKAEADRRSRRQVGQAGSVTAP